MTSLHDDPDLHRSLPLKQNPSVDDEGQILALFEAGDKALVAADVTALAEIFDDDYVQYDDAGHPHTKQRILKNLRRGDIRYPSIVSTRRDIRVFGDSAVVHGAEDDVVETGGIRSFVTYLYLDVLLKRNGVWKIVASQLARPATKSV